MEYLVPVLILVGAAVLVTLVFWWGSKAASAQKARGGTKTQGSAKDRRVSATSAAQASARLDEQEHQNVYRKIASGQLTEAAEIYRQATGVTPLEAILDVQALATYPQQWVKLEDVTETEDTSEDAEDAELTIPTDWMEEKPQPAKRSFQVEVIREDGTVRLSSEDLPPWLSDQMHAMVRDGQLEEAAKTMAEHTILTEHESRELMQALAREEQGPKEES